jgi:hypothetical protein
MSQIPQKSLRILFKAALLFLAFNFVFILVPNFALWKVTIFNTILPGRPRFTLENDLDFLFNMHEIASSPNRDEFKVVVLGDSSTWGFLLSPEETFFSQISASNLTYNNQPVHVYNLGYPKFSVFKDLILLQRALTYKPDLMLWNVTLNSALRESKQHPSWMPTTPSPRP